jgi:hypothetical protein
MYFCSGVLMHFLYGVDTRSNGCADRPLPLLVSVAKKESGFGFRPEQIFLNHLKPKFLGEPVKWNAPLCV